MGSLLFVGTFAVVVETSVHHGRDGPAAPLEMGHSSAASRLASTLVEERGQGWYTGAAQCDLKGTVTTLTEADNVSRLGLGAETCSVVGNAEEGVNRLDFDKIQTLMGGLMVRNGSNKNLDYAEARDSLGLTAVGYDFHLRSHPILPDARRALAGGFKDPYLRPLYVGDYVEDHGGGPQTFLVQQSAGVSNASAAVTLWVNVTNNGTVATAFSVVFKIPTTSEIVVELHTPLLAIEASHNVTMLLNKTAGWAWKNAGDEVYRYTIRDPSKDVGNGTVSMSGLGMAGDGTTRKVLTLESNALQYRRNGQGDAKPDLTYDALDGAGDSGVTHTGWSLKIYKPDGQLLEEDGDLNDRGGTKRLTVSTLGVYRAELWGASGWLAQVDRFHVVDDDLARFNPGNDPGQWIPQDSTRLEAEFLERLVRLFDLGVVNASYEHASLPFVEGGDVYPDDNSLLADRFPSVLLDAQEAGTLAAYNLVVVGSNVAHNALTSGNVKAPIEKWVKAGGTLIVFGSSSQAVQWMEPLFKSGIVTASGGLSVPDETHPLLTNPNRLDPEAYDDHGTAWDVDQRSRDLFTHVVTGADPNKDILAVSNPGSFGAGRIILTSWQPHDLRKGDPPAECRLTTLTEACPGLQVMHNLLSMAYRGLYLDYGPPIPNIGTVGVQSRIVGVYHPELGRLLEVAFIVYVFR